MLVIFSGALCSLTTAAYGLDDIKEDMKKLGLRVGKNHDFKKKSDFF